MSVSRTSCIKKFGPHFPEMELMIAKSKEDFLKEYEKYDEQNAKFFYLRVLTEVENSIIDGDVDKLKSLSNLIDYINCVKNYRSTTKDFLKATNLVVLTCKLNKVYVLQYLFNSDDKLLNKLSFYSGIYISPSDEDEMCHNAFYYAIRSGNVELLHALLGWPDENKEKIFDTHSEDLDRILSTTYEELKLKNVQLTVEMEFLVQNKLLNLRFYCNSSKQDRNTNLDNIEKRIKLVLDNIELLKNDYSNENVDERFLFIAKFIAQNIQILKCQLKFTYDRLPWEEMEFCLTCFVSSHIKKQEINLFNLATLNKIKILYHLENFAEELEEINREYLENQLENVKGKCSSKKPDAEITIEMAFAQLPISNREENLPDFLENKPRFCELYRNYQQIRDIYSLEKINKYIYLTLSSDPGEKHGQLIILRSLQVIGEHLKNTWESPKLSTATGDLILMSIPKYTRDVIQKMRDSLSKAQSLFVRTEIEEKSDAMFFTGIQNDVKRIGDVIVYILSNKKFKIIKELLQKIVNSKSIAEIKEDLEILSNAGGNISVSGIDLVGKIISENFKTSEDQRLEKLLRELRDNIPEKNSKEESLFRRISDLMNSAKYKLENMIIYYRLGFHKLKVLNIMMDSKVNQNAIRITKSIVARILENMPQPLESDTLKEIAKLSLEIFHSVKCKVNFSKVDEISRIISQIFYIADFKTKDIQWIQELNDKIYQKNSKNRMLVKGKYNSILESKQRELKNILNSLTLKGDLIENISDYKKNEKLQAVIEMLVLDIMSILSADQRLERNYLFLDENYPLINGRCLRNHLAHENILVALLTDPSVPVLLNAIKLTEDDVLTSSKHFGKLVKDDPSKVRKKCEKHLQTINIQKKMFAALEEGKMLSFKKCLTAGADVNARNIDLWTALHFAAKGQNLETLKFIHAQNPNADVKDINCRSPLHIAAAYGRTNNTKYLIEEAGLPVSEVDSSKNSPLHIAAQNGHKETVTLLLKYKSDVWMTHDFTPLYSAIRNNHIDIVQLLLEENGNMNMHESVGGFSPLHDAAERGHLEIVQLLLEMNADVNAKSDTDYTPLHAAALNGNPAVVNALILKGANVNAEDVGGCTPLNHAVLNNHEEVVKILLNHGGNPNLKQKIHKYTPLHLAANNGYEEIVTILLDYQANINEPTAKKRTPINIAASQGHVKVLLILIRRGANINSRSEEEFTPLHCAAFKGYEIIVKILIKKGVKIDATTTRKWTPLYLATVEGHKDVVKLLIEKKADIYAKDNDQSSILHAAAFNGSKEIIDIFLSYKIDVNARNTYGSTPMHIAACNGHSDALHSLIRNQAKINISDIWGFTPLHAAVMEGRKDAVDILIHNNAEINAKDNENCIPLHFAIDMGHLDIINILTQNGSDVNAKRNGNLSTPLLSAIKHNHKEIIDILILKGADVNGEKGEPLRLAVIAGYSDVVTKLIDKNARIDVTYSKDFTLLHFAAMYGHKKIVNILIKMRVHVNAITINNLTPLHFAAHEGYEDIVQILIEEGSDVTIKSDTGFTSLHSAAEQGHSKVVEILLRNEKNLNAKDHKNRTPLELAVSNGQFEVVKLFLHCKDININAKGNDDCTMLHVAAQSFNLETVKILVKYGADINARNYFTLKPIHIAAKKGFKEAVEFFLNVGSNVNDCCAFNMTLLHFATLENRLEIVKFLLNKKANVNAKNAAEVSPLHIAAEFCNKDIAEVLLKHGAAYNDADKNGNKPLDMTNDDIVRSFLTTIDSFFKAVKSNNDSEVDRCINAGVVVDVKNRKGEAPLHYAAWKGYDKIVYKILEYNANPNVTNKKGFTPLHYAVKFSHRKIIKALLSHGAVFNIHSHDDRTPIDLSTDEDISNLLNFVSELFEDVKNRDPRTINKLSNVKDIDIMRAIMCTCNENHKTLTVLAIQKNLPAAEQLKDILQDGDPINTASMFAEKGDYQKALDIFTNVFEKRKNILGINNPGSLEIERHIALILYKQGKYGEALNKLENIFLKQKTILGSKHQHTMNTRSSIALILHTLGRNEEAFHICQEVYPKQKEIVGPNHADTSNTELHMAFVITAQGKCEHYPEIIKTVFEKESEFLELETFRGLEAKSNIATILANMGMNEEALKLYENVLEIRMEKIKINHIDTLRTLQSIAQVYSNQKKYHKALEVHQEVLKKQKTFLGFDHPDTLKTEYNLMNTLYSRGKNVAFFKIYKERFKQLLDLYGLPSSFVQDISAKMEIVRSKLTIEGCRVEEILQMQDDIKTAARDGDAESIQRLLKSGADLNVKDSYGRAPLHYATNNGHSDVVNILLENGATVNDKDNEGITPLHCATSNGHIDIVNKLLYNGACVNQSIDEKITPLHVAVLNSNKELVEFFLKHVSRDELGDFINTKTISSGNTALHMASQKGYLEIFHILLRYGASYDIENNECKRPLDLSTDKTISALLELLEELFVAAEKGDERIIEKLKELKADNILEISNVRNKGRKTLIQVSIINKHRALAKKLVELFKAQA